VLERDENYWKGKPPMIDAIEFRAGLSTAGIAAGLRSGELDWRATWRHRIWKNSCAIHGSAMES
jgi:ABC-type transport system substrate-binding protein